MRAIVAVWLRVARMQKPRPFEGPGRARWPVIRPAGAPAPSSWLSAWRATGNHARFCPVARCGRGFWSGGRDGLVEGAEGLAPRMGGSSPLILIEPLTISMSPAWATKRFGLAGWFLVLIARMSGLFEGNVRWSVVRCISALPEALDFLPMVKKDMAEGPAPRGQCHSVSGAINRSDGGAGKLSKRPHLNEGRGVLAAVKTASAPPCGGGLRPVLILVANSGAAGAPTRVGP